LAMSNANDSPGQPWNPRLYDDRHAFVWRHGASLVELLAPQPGERILDLGCGTGHLTAQIAAAGATVVGIDSSPEMIAEARRTHPGLGFEVADARALDFVAAFDAVFSNAALHWVKEADAVAAGVARALKPGGRFVAEFGGKRNVRLIADALAESLSAVGVEPVASPWYFPSVAEYARVLERAGLEVTFALLFDRPTPLEGGEAGLRAWVEMFGGYYLTRVPRECREEYLRRVEDALRPALVRDGGWVADYHRLRVVAVPFAPATARSD
jgi:trans-aconitate methyltransferase